MAREHAFKSAAMARKICQRLRFSRRQADPIELSIANHLQPFVLFQAQQKKIPILSHHFQWWTRKGFTDPARRQRSYGK